MSHENTLYHSLSPSYPNVNAVIVKKSCPKNLSADYWLTVGAICWCLVFSKDHLNLYF